MKPSLIKQIHRHFAVDIPLCDGRISGVDRPFGPYNLGIAIRYILDISEGNVTRNLLLQRQSRLRRIGGPDNLRVDTQLADSKQALQPA